MNNAEYYINVGVVLLFVCVIYSFEIRMVKERIKNLELEIMNIVVCISIEQKEDHYEITAYDKYGTLHHYFVYYEADYKSHSVIDEHTCQVYGGVKNQILSYYFQKTHH